MGLYARNDFGCAGVCPVKITPIKGYTTHSGWVQRSCGGVDNRMVFSIGWITLYLLEKPRSLKEKRRVVKSLKDRVRARFNVSISEVDDQNLWHRSTLGIALVFSDRKQAQTISDKIVEFIKEVKKVEIIDHDFIIENH